MTLSMVATIQRFLALSSDELPNSESDNPPPEGSTVHLIDTGEEYIYFCGTWERDKRTITAIKDANI